MIREDAPIGHEHSHRFHGTFDQANVLVTGHTGFKGSWLCRWLELCGARVHGYALDPAPHATLFDRLDLPARLAGDHRADVKDANKIHQVMQAVQPDFVFHLAAQPLVRLSYREPQETFATNVMGTVHLLDALRSLTKPCQVIVVTTDKCYANQEWDHGYREEDPLGGKDPYSASKAAAEIVAASYRESFFAQGPVQIASARAGNVIGGGDWAEDRIIPDCIRAIRAGTSIAVRNRFSTRPWQHVLEPLSGYLWLAARLHQSAMHPTATKDSASRPSVPKNALATAFNFGPSLHSNRTVAELVDTLTNHFPGSRWHDESDPTATHEAARLDLAIAKAHHQLGWSPVWNFDQTIQRTADWYRAESLDQDVLQITDQQISAYCQAADEQSLHWADTNPLNPDNVFPRLVA